MSAVHPSIFCDIILKYFNTHVLENWTTLAYANVRQYTVKIADDFIGSFKHVELSNKPKAEEC
jgi:hypothetical protein